MDCAKEPKPGGLIAAAPLVSLLAVIWLGIGRENNQQIAEFLVGVLKGMIPTAISITTVVICLRRGIPLAVALVVGTVAWTACTVGFQWTGIFRV